MVRYHFLVGPLYNDKTDHVISVSCGSEHTVVLSNSGSLFSFGSESDGKLGLGFVNENVYLPRNIAEIGPATIGQVVAGDTFTIAVTLSGCRVYKFGKIASSTKYMLPELMKDFPPKNHEVTQVSASGNNCIFLVEDNDNENPQVFTFGGDLKALGQGKIRRTRSKPSVIRKLNNKNVQQVSCGRRHMGVATSSGELYTWGYGPCGELANEKMSQHALLRPKQQQVPNGVKVNKVVCGNGFTAAVLEHKPSVESNLLIEAKIDKPTLYGVDENGYNVQSFRVPSRFQDLEVTGSFIAAGNQLPLLEPESDAESYQSLLE